MFDVLNPTLKYLFQLLYAIATLRFFKLLKKCECRLCKVYLSLRPLSHKIQACLGNTTQIFFCNPLVTELTRFHCIWMSSIEILISYARTISNTGGMRSYSALYYTGRSRSKSILNLPFYDKNGYSLHIPWK